MANVLIRKIQNSVAKSRHAGINRSDDWGGRRVAGLNPKSVLDVGCGDGSRLIPYFKNLPSDFCGIEGAPELMQRAKERGLTVKDCDLNGRWPWESGRFDVVFSNQVIEHVHNCRMFAAEAYRVLKPGGTAIITSENLCSLLNCAALIMGYTPFSLMQTCGRYLGNPLGLHYNETLSEPLPLDHPAFSGVSGHIRILTVRQARELFELVGFRSVKTGSISILPLPDQLSQWLEKFVANRGHYLQIEAVKPRE
ncbi:MAG TPA: class I SAM-dependent methyltransferase [Verrucomicrobiae bacterium]|nr:class I SAM-dependent methyltransferase [Verrucomicrobiae bacterium]